MTHTLEELRRIDTGIADRVGWDFSRMRDHRAPRLWEYETVIARMLGASDHVLDQGTGGGELLVRNAHLFGSCIAVDRSEPMLAEARRNCASASVRHVGFAQMDAQTLGFANASFDAVINRHAPYEAAEIARVLRPGGCFVTQQVAAGNAQSLFDCFEWDGTFPKEGSVSLHDRAAEFERCGLRVVGLARYSVNWWTEDLESLLFWLRSVPTPAPFELERHWQGPNVAESSLHDERGSAPRKCVTCSWRGESEPPLRRGVQQPALKG